MQPVGDAPEEEPKDAIVDDNTVEKSANNKSVQQDSNITTLENRMLEMEVPLSADPIWKAKKEI
jgi:hypothetical protein